MKEGRLKREGGFSVSGLLSGLNGALERADCFFAPSLKEQLRGNTMPISAIAGLASRRVLALVLLMAFVLGMTVPALAGTTGVLSGTITATGSRPVNHATL